MDENFGIITRFNKNVISLGSAVIVEMEFNNIIFQQKLDFSHNKPHINNELYRKERRNIPISWILGSEVHYQELST